jgi:hypothetical protein
VADKLSALKALHADLKASRGPDRALDARIFQVFDPEARVLPWPKWIDQQIAGRDDFKRIKHFTSSVDAALSTFEDPDAASVLREVARDLEKPEHPDRAGVLPHIARAIVLKNIEHTIMMMTLSGDIFFHGFRPGEKVKLTKAVSAEGETFQSGTDMEIEQVYDDSIDLIHPQTGTLMWVRPDEIAKSETQRRHV